jgi:methylated-DNA-protein-cysteine methyltransferase-like protein
MDPRSVEAICRVVRAIPCGEVTTYGAVARKAGLPGRARLVGRVLKVTPASAGLPWHRVLGAGGRIVFPAASRTFAEQRRRLRAEGVVVTRGRVVRGEAPDLDELLWKPLNSGTRGRRGHATGRSRSGRSPNF